VALFISIKHLVIGTKEYSKQEKEPQASASGITGSHLLKHFERTGTKSFAETWVTTVSFFETQ